MRTTRMALRSALKPFRHPRLWTGIWCFGIALVVVLSLLPAPDLPQPPGGDKLHHFLAYGVLAAWAVQLYARWPSLLGASNTRKARSPTPAWPMVATRWPTRWAPSPASRHG